MEHEFTRQIKAILKAHFGKAAEDIYEKNSLLQYLNIKTRSANRGSKARGSFANIYAVFVLLEDYLKHGFDKKGNYANYEGAKFTNLFQRQRELPFGNKLQNHALNHRLNEEFILGLLAPNVDARIFEIVSYAILLNTLSNVMP